MYCVGNHEIELTDGHKDFLSYETRCVGGALGSADTVALPAGRMLWWAVAGRRASLAAPAP